MSRCPDLERLADGLPPHTLLVLDGAYAEYVDGYDSGAAMVDARDNVVMTRTFSKLHGLGGLRIGWGYGPAHVMDVLGRLRGPFNLSNTQLEVAEAALGDEAHIARSLSENARLRDWLADRLNASGVATDRSWPISCWPGLRVPNRPLRAMRRCGRWPDRAASVKLRVARSPAHNRGRRICVPPGRPWHRTFHGGAGMTPVPARRLCRAGADRIVDGAGNAPGAGLTETAGTARSPATRAIAVEIGLVDRVTDTAAEAVEGADLVVLCVRSGPWPPSRRILRRIWPRA